MTCGACAETGATSPGSAPLSAASARRVGPDPLIAGGDGSAPVRTTRKPVMLDLFCGAGGAAHGYQLAGFHVIGVDHLPQPRYAGDEFIQADWEEPLGYLPGLCEREGIAYAVHASPPCQRFSTMTKKWGREDSHSDLIESVQYALRCLSDEGGVVPYVIENVVGAPLDDPLTLCGSMFGLGSQGYQLRRHRIFESNVFMFPPASCAHAGQALPVYGHAGGRSKRDGLKFPGTDAWREGMGIDWMTGNEMAEAIPPAYTEYIGQQLIALIREAASALNACR